MIKEEMIIAGNYGSRKYESAIWKSCKLAEELKLNNKMMINKFLYSVTPVWLFPKVNVDFYIQNEVIKRKGKGNWDYIVEK